MIPLDQPLDLNHADANRFLECLQGNILKSHGRDHAAHVFLRFAGAPTQARACIARFADRSVTSAAGQQAQRARWRAQGGPGELFASLLLSQSGYEALGVPAESIPVEANRTYFQRGMRNQAQAERPFNDPPASTWEAGFQDPLHALVILAHDDLVTITQHVAELRASFASVAEVRSVEMGHRVVAQFPSGPLTIEHFGFEDGISNPLLILQQAEEERRARGAVHWDPAAPLSLALAAEPNASDRFGSFFVFRKLEQNVRGFAQAVAALARQLTPGAPDIERAGAMAVGRFRDGTPIVPATAPVAGAKLNDFTFATADPAGRLCPFHAHIRKTNPRGDLPIGPDVERTFRVVRRGITYGARPDLAPGTKADPPESGVGLLFMSYQARLDGFAIQQEGSDSNDFAQPGVGVDAVIGQHAAPVAQEWPEGSGQEFLLANFVKMLGGEYFFAPSIPFLREL